MGLPSGLVAGSASGVGAGLITGMGNRAVTLAGSTSNSVSTVYTRVLAPLLPVKTARIAKTAVTRSRIDITSSGVRFIIYLYYNTSQNSRA